MTVVTTAQKPKLIKALDFTTRGKHKKRINKFIKVEEAIS